MKISLLAVAAILATSTAFAGISKQFSADMSASLAQSGQASVAVINSLGDLSQAAGLSISNAIESAAKTTSDASGKASDVSVTLTKSVAGEVLRITRASGAVMVEVSTSAGKFTLEMSTTAYEAVKHVVQEGARLVVTVSGKASQFASNAANASANAIVSVARATKGAASEFSGALVVSGQDTLKLSEGASQASGRLMIKLGNSLGQFTRD